MVTWSLAERLRALSAEDFTWLLSKVRDHLHPLGRWDGQDAKIRNVDDLVHRTDRTNPDYNPYLDGRAFADAIGHMNTDQARRCLEAMLAKAIHVHVPTDPKEPPLPRPRGMPAVTDVGRLSRDSGLLIRILVTGNPTREGSKVHERWTWYRDGGTVADFVAKGGSLGDVKCHISRGWIKLEDPSRSEAPAPRGQPRHAA